LNQKLCDIRNQAASIAIGYVDDDFRADNDISESTDLTQAEISELREQYAKDRLADKKFIFGKYAISNGKLCISIILSCNALIPFIYYRHERLFRIKAGPF
jgi:uncharacterized protein YgiM (DUF1202 family)